MIRFIRLLQPVQGVSTAALETFRRDKLGPLIASYQTDLQLIRYVQTHRCASSTHVESSFIAQRPGARNDFVGVEEFWWKNAASARAALLTDDGAFAKITRFQDEWISRDTSVGWIGVDYPQVAAAVGQVTAAPKSGIVRLIFALSPLQSCGEAEARRYWLAEHGPLIRSLAPARGALAYIQVHRQREDLERALSAAHLIAESPFIGHAEAWFSDAAASLGSDAQAAVQAAVMDERKFIDWNRSFVFVGKELVFVNRNWL